MGWRGRSPVERSEAGRSGAPVRLARLIDQESAGIMSPKFSENNLGPHLPCNEFFDYCPRFLIASFSLFWLFRQTPSLDAGCRGTLGTHFINRDVLSSFRVSSCCVWTIYEVPGDPRPPYSDAALQRAQLAG
jgi:hypothetical protein